MGRYTILKNSSIDVQLISDYQDNGWSFVGGNAVHDGINEGSLRNKVVKTDVGETYKSVFTVSGLSGGTLIVYIGGVQFDITANGSYVREATAIDNTGIVLWSDADVIVSPVALYRGEEGYNTLLFNPQGVFDSYISFTSDYMVRLLGSYYTFKNGELWKHNENEIRNSFYGETHKSILKFIFNPEPRIIKNLQTMKINGSKQYGKYTTKGNARGGNHASLYYSVLLPRKGLLQKSRLFKKLCQGLDKKEAQKASRDIEGRYDTSCKIELHYYDAEQNAQHEAHHKGPQCQLIPP